MNADTLLENFEILAEAPGGIDRLREIVISLAVQGRLLSEWNGKFDTDNKLPSEWKLQRLDEVCSYIQRGKGPKYVDRSNCVVVSQKCVQWTGFDISKARFVDEESLSAYGDERFLRNGDILWNSTGTGTVGRTAVYHDSLRFKKVVADSHVTVLRAPDMDSRFLWYWTASPAIQSKISDLTSGTTNQQELNLSSIKSLLVPVPSPAEQKRIVAKVDELMALCDQLEQQQTQRDNLRTATQKSAIDAISTATTPEELEAAWKRINNNWEVIADTPESIESLRELILRMAAKGFFIDPSLSQYEVEKFTTLNSKSANRPKLRSFFNSRGKIVYEIQIADAADLVPQARSKIKTNQIKQSGKHPVVDQGQQFISGFIDDVAPISASDKAVLVFGDHTRNIKFIDFDFVVGSDGVKVLCAKFLEPKFFYYMARSINLPSRGYGRHYKAFCSNYIPIFSQSEQMMTVSTVEKLMSLCDQLEIELKLRSEASEKFARSVLSAA